MTPPPILHLSVKVWKRHIFSDSFSLTLHHGRELYDHEEQGLVALPLKPFRAICLPLKSWQSHHCVFVLWSVSLAAVGHWTNQLNRWIPEVQKPSGDCPALPRHTGITAFKSITASPCSKSPEIWGVISLQGSHPCQSDSLLLWFSQSTAWQNCERQNAAQSECDKGFSRGLLCSSPDYCRPRQLCLGHHFLYQILKKCKC